LYIFFYVSKGNAYGLLPGMPTIENQRLRWLWKTSSIPRL